MLLPTGSTRRASGASQVKVMLYSACAQAKSWTAIIPHNEVNGSMSWHCMDSWAESSAAFSGAHAHSNQ